MPKGPEGGDSKLITLACSSLKISCFGTLEINHEVSEIIHSIIKEEDEFSHAYGGDGKIAIREMKPNEHAKTIEDEMSKLFRIHSKGVFNEIIKREEVINPLRDILGENIDCFLSQFIFKNPDYECVSKADIRVRGNLWWHLIWKDGHPFFFSNIKF